MKKFFKEFKTFISRGNVVDMAVGVIIGGAFSAIVSALTNWILQPLINWVFYLIFRSDDPLKSFRTLLHPVYVLDEVTLEATTEIDWTKSIFIDWGAFITAIINFLLIALVLFIIVKTINSVKESSEKLGADAAEKKRVRKYNKLVKKNEKLVNKGKEPLPIPAELLPPAPPAPAPEPEPVVDPQVELLTQIRDLLQSKK